ncbi:GNAT family N-acetyltransferase [Epilithonimonas hungarica]|uniref:Acetyltransferase (GNAT) domain-containing protein n=1 Tax=Epilithonimonas hungarica TaxID=454006 RepID=A0A1G7S4J3_9FLAO|nr:GNAT family N-acetyltransferase [Epilithonimonas hungarica]SDG17901.1 Acetyltransferase (GNAT) domain-containing protein [Epilithonimonas hungarica]
MITISNFNKSDQREAKNFVLNIQNVEFLLGFTEAEQPDLGDLEKFYSNGGFWVAKTDNEIIGTIGLQRLNDSNGILRKMFVKKEYRGKAFGISQQLFDTLIDFAKANEIKNIWLDTPGIATASHKFYERNGFRPADKTNLPQGYVYPDRNSKIYTRTIN